MSPIINISVIIPNAHDHYDLLKIVNAVCVQTIKPYEIVVVDSFEKNESIASECGKLCANQSIKLIYEYRKYAFPGDARNIGITKANCELVAFIDVQTIPKPQWLEVSLGILTDQNAEGVWGSTCFYAQTKFEQLVRDGIYGTLPRRTLPGSIFKREIFSKIGHFIEWVRAGEDTEWMLRLEVHKIRVAQTSISLADYIGLLGIDIKQLVGKWHRNYKASRELPHFFPQRLLLWLIFYPLIILIALNWNYLIADWRTESPFYIGHVTKMTVIIPVFIYLILRGFILPYRRGVSIRQLLPTRFILIAIICAISDCVKVLVFSVPNFVEDKEK